MILLAIPLVAACGPVDEVGVSSFALTEASPAHYPPVGWLVIRHRPRDSHVDEYSDCTAALVGRQTILTAGHCLKDGRTRYTFRLFDERGRTESYTAKDPRRPEGYELVTLPDGRGEYAVNDLALFTLSKAPPTSVVRASLTARRPAGIATELATVNLAAVALGVGPQRTGRASGTLRSTPVLLPEPAESASRHGAGETWMTVDEDNGHGGFIRGDSGGPTIVHLDPIGDEPTGEQPTTRWVAVGIHTTRNYLHNANVDMPLSEWLPWIREAAAGDICEDELSPAADVTCSGCLTDAPCTLPAPGELPANGKSDAAGAPAPAAGCGVAPAAAAGDPLPALLLLMACLLGRRRQAVARSLPGRCCPRRTLRGA